MACSIFNRDAPDVTCAELGGRNACSNGIIASCPDGKTIKYEVCTADINGIGADELCEASWQCPGAYRCDPDRECASAGGAGGGGGAGAAGGGGAGQARLEVDHVTVNDGFSGDGVLSPGETGWLSIFVRNTGDATATDVGASTSVEDSRVEVVDCGGYNVATGCCVVTQTSCDDCLHNFEFGCQPGPGVPAGGSHSYPIAGLQVAVSDAASAGDATVLVTLRAAEGIWEDSFTVPIVAAQNTGGGTP